VARSRVEEPVVLQKPTNAIALNNRIARSLGLLPTDRATSAETVSAFGAMTRARA
jgi:hypothetical protein